MTLYSTKGGLSVYPPNPLYSVKTGNTIIAGQLYLGFTRNFQTITNELKKTTNKALYLSNQIYSLFSLIRCD